MPEELNIHLPEVIRGRDGIIAKYSGGVIKRISPRQFEAYIVRWHDPDGKPRLDLTGEWFSRKTYLMLNAGYPIVGMPINYQHGMTKEFGAQPFGLVSFTEENEIGQFIRVQLKEYDDYQRMLQEVGRKFSMNLSEPQIRRRCELALKSVDALLSDIPLRMSGGFDPSTWIVNPADKHIDQAGTIHGATTPTPADDLNPQIQVKSTDFDTAWNEVFKYEPTTSYSIPNHSISPDAPHADGNVPDGETTRKDAPQSEVEPPPPVQTGDASTSPAKTLKETIMDPNQAMIDAIAQAVAAQVLAGVSQLLSKEGQAAEQLPAEADVVAALRADAPADENMKPEDMAKAFAEKAYKFVMDAVEKRRSAAKSAATVTNDFLKRHLPAVDDFPAGSSKSNGHLQVGDNLRYAHLNAAEMALGLLMRKANAPKGMTFPVEQFVSTDYLKNMVGKMERELERGTVFKDERNLAAVKAVMPALKANEIDASNNTGFGLEFVSDWWSSQIWEVARANPIYKEVIARGIWEEVIPEGRSNGTFPTTGSDPTAYVRNQANSLDTTGRPETTVNISRFGTGNVTITPNELAIASSFTTIEQEDSIIPIAAHLNKQLAAKMDETIEQALINGDTAAAANTNINIIDGTPATGLSKPYYLLTDGWMKEALVTSTAYSRSGGAIDENDVRLTVKLMLKAIRNRKDKLVFVVDSDTYNTMLDIVAIKTDDVRARNSTLTTGDVESVYGYKVLESAFIELANSAGKVPAAGNGTLGRMLLVYPDYWGIAWKRRMTVEQGYDVESGTYVYVASLRMGMKPRGASSSAVSYNLTIA